MRKLAVVVLAAGEGSRMKSKTPKVLHEIAGMPMLGHVLATAHALNADQVITVLRHSKEQIEQYILSHFPRTQIANQDEIPGTGRAVEAALELLSENFEGDVLILSGDVPLLDVASIQELIEIKTASAAAGALVSTFLENPNGYGRIVRARESLVGIVEQKDASEKELEIQETNAGVYVFDFAKLKTTLEKVGTNNAQKEKYLTDVVGLMLEAGEKVTAHPISDHWLVSGVNDRVQLAQVSAELNRRIVQAWQLAGVTVREPHSTWIDITVQIGMDAVLEPSSRLYGLTQVGEGAEIGPDTTLRDCEVGANATVIRTHADSARIGADATVGPFSYLRPGTELGEDAKIGAFVETKNSKIGRASKVPHLSYVGDAVIGEESNIGAGTIFANYDGEKKHRTEIGSGVRTGSANVFVAPVKIGDGAYTAAGTVVRKEVGAGDLALNPKPQQNLAGWVLERRPGTVSAEMAKRKLEK